MNLGQSGQRGTSKYQRIRSRLGVGILAVAALTVGGVHLGTAQAAPGDQPVIVTNGTDKPVPVTVQNHPLSQTVRGTVNVGNLPAVQTVLPPEPVAFSATGDATPSGWSAANGYETYVNASLAIPTGKRLTTRYASAQVTVPADGCYVRSVIVFAGNNPMYLAAQKVSAIAWVASGDVVMPGVTRVLAHVVCPTSNARSYISAAVSGDLY